MGPTRRKKTWRALPQSYEAAIGFNLARGRENKFVQFLRFFMRAAGAFGGCAENLRIPLAIYFAWWAIDIPSLWRPHHLPSILAIFLPYALTFPLWSARGAWI